MQLYFSPKESKATFKKLKYTKIKVFWTSPKLLFFLSIVPKNNNIIIIKVEHSFKTATEKNIHPEIIIITVLIISCCFAAINLHKKVFFKCSCWVFASIATYNLLFPSKKNTKFWQWHRKSHNVLCISLLPQKVLWTHVFTFT